MTKDNYNRIKRSFTHLSDTQRGKLEILAKEIYETPAGTAQSSTSASPRTRGSRS